MKYLFLSLFFIFGVHAQCFKSEALNSHFATKYGDCAKFPETIKDKLIYVPVENEFIFYQQDINRLPEMNMILLRSTGHYKIKLDGPIIFPASLYALSLESNPTIDFALGDWTFTKPLILDINYIPELIERLNNYSLKELNLTMGENGLKNKTWEWPGVKIVLQGCSEITNSTISARTLEVKNFPQSKIQNTRITAQTLRLSNVKLLDNNIITLNGDLRLDNFESTGSLPLSSSSRLVSIKISESKTGLELSDSLSSLENIYISNSVISSLNFPGELPQLKGMHLSKTEAPFPNFPKMPKLEKIVINAPILENTLGPLILTTNLSHINLNESGLKRLHLQLDNPKSLKSFYLLGNNIKELEIIAHQNAKILPSYFSMYVDSPKVAKELRRTLKRKSVVSMNY